MSDVEVKSFIVPQRDTANSRPAEVEFTSTSDGRIVIALDDRHLTFTVLDFKRLVKITLAAMDDSE